MGNFKISIGELIDRISILNVKIWHSEEAFSNAKNKKDIKQMANIAILTRTLNSERACLREEINICLEGIGRGSTKINYMKLGREK